MGGLSYDDGLSYDNIISDILNLYKHKWIEISQSLSKNYMCLFWYQLLNNAVQSYMETLRTIYSLLGPKSYYIIELDKHATIIIPFLLIPDLYCGNLV